MEEPRYIDLNSINIKDFMKRNPDNYRDSFVDGVGSTLNKLVKMPSADVQEVVHTRWMAKDGQIICNKCNAVKPRDYNCLDNFCPSCGAKMDKED